MSAGNNGGPAFPTLKVYTDRDGEVASTCEDGMSLRDYFAAKIMAMLLRGAHLPPEYDAARDLAFAARRAYEAADAMLAERAKGQP